MNYIYFMDIFVEIQSEIVYIKCKHTMNTVGKRRQNLRSVLFVIVASGTWFEYDNMSLSVVYRKRNNKDTMQIHIVG